MKRSLRILALLALWLPEHAAGEIAVQILDAPTSVYSYEPVFVILEVRNEGDGPLTIPVSPCRREGVFVETGPLGRQLEHKQIGSHCQRNRLVRLAPGQRWLFFQEVGRWLGPEGEFELQAVLQSAGECHGSFVNCQAPLLAPSRSHESQESVYECWDGEVRSQKLAVSVMVPTADVDLAAKDFLRLDAGKERVVFLLRQRELFDRFPTSHYAYAAAAYSMNIYSMAEMVVRQPENPLNPWTVGFIASQIAYQNRPCGAKKEADPFDGSLDRYEPSALVKEYLEQLRLEYAAERCPERKKESPEGRAVR